MTPARATSWPPSEIVACGLPKRSRPHTTSKAIHARPPRRVNPCGNPVPPRIHSYPVETLKSFKAKGRTAAERERVLAEAQAADQAGAFALVVEGVASDLADEVTRAVAAPTIGIGASAGCDGQILVTDDMLGLFDWTPKFVRRYADMKSQIERAVRANGAERPRDGPLL